MDGTTDDQELLSDDGSHKVVLHFRKDGTIEVRLLRWTREIVPDYGEVCEPYWDDVPQSKTLVDSRERAEELAAAMLRGVF